MAGDETAGAAGDPGAGDIGAVEIGAEDFRAVFRRHAGGVAVVTALGPDGPVGFTATSVASVSVDPPYLAFSVNASSSSRAIVAAARTVVVNVLSAGQADVASRFAAPAQDRFAGIATQVLPNGDVALAGAVGWVQGQIEQATDVAGSLLVVVRALRAGLGPEDWPLVYVNHAFHALSEDSRLS
ncbi:NADH-FMN oxidoreductase RutF, flavin reductase (DIM6/NTAB) family [Raineyella antarctica]|uniref:NADH-FMN oxidoreductase RutF, flavin reductase (DIM6/NTAB) family n=1 Tax=Raineyella antarctica TaxID=1577474 RepID=A0A1G6GDC0_9ACTN|nr:flavin reductase family protein [Raineyella antarctica]SDB80002.1 NADH-FMN oxidoreductase RutF, flavin reductase (DIM6/NTAB) family [Raineyella antarctica]